jgi:hypothetical protein
MKDIINELVRLLQSEMRDVNDRPRKLACHSTIMLNALAIKDLYSKATLNPENDEHLKSLKRVTDQCDLILIGIDTKKYTNVSINELIRKIKDLKFAPI